MRWYTPTYVVLALLLGGCASYYRAKSQVIESGAEVADAVLADAELIQCRVISIGAWQRRFGQSQDLMDAWNTLCVVNPITLPVPE